MKVITKEDFRTFVNRLIREDPRTVIGVKARGNKFVFDELDSAEELRLDHDTTLLSPKKYFLPQYEALMRYDLTKGFDVKEVNVGEPCIIIGVHPYDIAAIQQMDRILRDGTEDHHYLKRRERSMIIGVNIKNPSPHAFAGSMGTAVVESGFDLMLTDIGNGYAIEIGTPQGREVLERYATAAEAGKEIAAEVAKIKERIPSKFQKQLQFPLKELPALLQKHMDDDPFWDERSELCLSCGSCILTCPTCYCFDVQDIPDLSLRKGEKRRTWDGCMLEEFAKVATGENFRGTQSKRYRHRYLKKGLYLHTRFGIIGCVGCGRCASACLPDIADPTKVFNALKEAAQ
ncbi:MAG: 4Fe-4S dicluster domain-containing protein [Candidatus Thermoplasmatota archaeon]